MSSRFRRNHGDHIESQLRALEAELLIATVQHVEDQFDLAYYDTGLTPSDRPSRRGVQS